jgi:hypothetical protein
MQKYLSPYIDSQSKEILRAAGLLAFRQNTQDEPYKSLYSPLRWTHLCDLFINTHHELLSLPSQPLLHIALSAGLSALNSGDTVYVWTGSGYYSSTFFGGPNGFLTPPSDWIDDTGTTTNSPALVPGQGFFYSTASGGQETNTWTGSVVLTNQVALPGGGAFSLLGSAAPIADSADGTNLNLPLDSGDTVYVWTGNGYYSSTFFGGPDGFLTPPNQWIDDTGTTTNAPQVSVGQGFFYSTASGSAETWKQNVSYILNP